MSATTFKNLVRRREHQERAQPTARERYGLLEKHKDYVERARNFHTKEKRIAALKQRAADRNEDEYYHKMHNLKTKGGVHLSTSTAPKFTADELKLLKTQDRAYIQTAKNAEDKKVERLRATLHGITEDGSAARSGRSHLKFDAEPAAGAGVTAAAELEVSLPTDTRGGAGTKRRRLPDPVEMEDDGDDDDAIDGVSGGASSLLKKKAKKPAKVPSAAAVAKRARKETEKAYAELAAHEERAAKMGRLLQQIDSERNLLKKGRRVKVADATAGGGAVFRWKAERKR